MTTVPEGIEWGKAVSLLEKIAGGLRWFRWGNRMVTHILARARLRTVADLSAAINAIHNLASSQSVIDALRDVPRHTLLHVCDEIRNAMAGVLGVQRHVLHCTVKLYIPEQTLEDGVIVTVGRSNDTQKSRWDEFGPDAKYRAADNSAYCALLGINDTRRSWAAAHDAFVCNDLAACGEYLNKRRTPFNPHYNATLVYPLLRPVSEPSSTRPLGFLTFDTLTPDGFAMLPSIYSYRTDRNPKDKALYHQLLHSSPGFHFGMALANALSMVLPGLLPEASNDAR